MAGFRIDSTDWRIDSLTIRIDADASAEVSTERQLVEQRQRRRQFAVLPTLTRRGEIWRGRSS